jgi:hypothetical protein
MSVGLVAPLMRMPVFQKNRSPAKNRPGQNGDERFAAGGAAVAGDAAAERRDQQDRGHGHAVEAGHRPRRAGQADEDAGEAHAQQPQ